MTRACPTCGSTLCDGIQCYLTDPADPETEVPAPRAKYVRSQEYSDWLKELDGGSDPLRHLEPKRKVA
jgi:PHP family Zn ribbon phosphoesterase